MLEVSTGVLATLIAVVILFRDINVRNRLEAELRIAKKQAKFAFRDSNVVCLGNLDPVIQLRVLEQVRQPALVVCDTMNFWIEQTPDALREVLRHVNCLIINDAEARQLSGKSNLVAAARHIRSMGPDILVIKKGEHGALLFTDGVVFSAPAYPLEEIHDPTGAGDTFAGGFAGYLAREMSFDLESLKRAVVFGSALASFCVERFGPDRLLDLTEDEVLARAEGFRELSGTPVLAPFQRVA